MITNHTELIRCLKWVSLSHLRLTLMEYLRCNLHECYNQHIDAVMAEYYHRCETNYRWSMKCKYRAEESLLDFFGRIATMSEIELREESEIYWWMNIDGKFAPKGNFHIRIASIGAEINQRYRQERLYKQETNTMINWQKEGF